jgi:hypothetical protein
MKRIKIFVSYSRRDSGDFADHIQQHYEKEGNEVFIESDDIELEKDKLKKKYWGQKIKRKL